MRKFGIIPFFILIIIGIYNNWFLSEQIIGGDWPFYYEEALREFPLFVNSWNTWQGNGLGGTNPAYFIQTYQNLTVFFSNTFHISWVTTYKIFWFGLFLILGVISSTYFCRNILKNFSLWANCFSIIIFLTNSYVVLLAAGGQLGVLLAYSITPLVIAVFIKLVDSVYLKTDVKQTVRSSLLAGLILSIQVLFDPRIAYLSLLIIFFYLIFKFFLKKGSISKILNSALFTLFIPLIISVLINANWILPYVLLKQNLLSDLGTAYSGVGMVNFLSFASFSQTFSLLHPNWPENLFGKVYFMRWEFLIIPIFAFVSFCFIDKKNQNKNGEIIEKIIFFGIIGLLGAFLAKGAKEPFGTIYIWLFQHIPGFILFRDPTKFYLFVIISYSILIPYGVSQLTIFLNQKLKKEFHKIIYYVILILFLGSWVFAIRQAFLGQMNGTFSYHKLPDEYTKLKNFLHNQPEFFRTLWIPRQNRFTFYSNSHPSVEAIPLFNLKNSSEVIKVLKMPTMPEYLSDLNIKYVIIPYDSLGEQFIKDRKYNPDEYNKLVKELQTISWLHQLTTFKKIAIFQVYSYKNHFYSEKGNKIFAKMITPYHYYLKINTNQKDRVIFSERYSPYWILKGDTIVYSKRTKNNTNSFVISRPGDHALEVYFLGHNYYEVGRFISLGSILIISSLLIVFKKNNSLHNK